MNTFRKHTATWVWLSLSPALLAGCQPSSGGGGAGVENDNAAEADARLIRLAAPPVDAGSSAPTYLWRQTDGPEISLDNRTRSELTFLPPEVAEDTVLHFVVTVTINGQPQDFEFEVTVPGQDSVAPTGQRPPAADAGSSQNVQVGDTVVLDASASLDPDGDQLSFAWTQTAPAGAGEPTPVTLQDPATVRALFRAPEAGVFHFAVAVSDGHYTVTAMTRVEVSGNGDDVQQLPVADPGADQTVTGGDVVILEGSASTDPNGDAVEYFWRQIAGPTVSLSDPNSARPTFTAPHVDEEVQLVFELTVTDADGASATSEPVTVTVAPRLEPPPGPPEPPDEPLCSIPLDFAVELIACGGNDPLGVAVLDANHDDIPDLAVANSNDGGFNATANVSILLGQGEATFGLSASYAAGDDPHDVAVGDLNGDGHVDLVVTNNDSDTISILFGDGTGLFESQITVDVGDGPVGVEVADLDDDGALDVVVANKSGGTVLVLMGNGAGGFPIQHQLDAGQFPFLVVVDDLDDDGIDDLVVSDDRSTTDEIAILIGLGDGTFQGAQFIATGGDRPRGIATGDFNSDGVVDLAVAGANGGPVSTLVGVGNGSFATPTSELVDGNAFDLLRTDINGDGIDDLIAAVPSRDEVVVMVGNGNATFNKTTYPAGDYPIRLAVADLDRDGDLDVIVSSSNNNAIAVMANLCNP